jgi:hypothetical protein
MSRPDLLAALFYTLDVDGDSRLSRDELCVFAGATGFVDGPAEWDDQFAGMRDANPRKNPFQALPMAEDAPQADAAEPAAEEAQP